MPGIKEAKLNFAAAKLTVVGSLHDEQLQIEARKIEPVVLRRMGSPVEQGKRSFLQANERATRGIGAGLMLVIGWLLFNQGVFPAAQIVLSLSILIAGYSLVSKGMRNLFHLQFEMNVLMTVAIVGAVVIGKWEEATVVTFLFLISEILETYSMEKARSSIRSLMDIAPKRATRIDNGQETVVTINQLKINDLILVRPGEKIPIDGVVAEGGTFVNQSAITGESMPVEKLPGNQVFAGTLNQQGTIQIHVTRLVQDSTFAKIIHLVEEAQAEKAPYQTFVDRFAKYYTPVVMMAALLTGLVPPLLFHAEWNKWVYEALALLVVACPCALVVSTPVAIVTAIGTAAKNGVLIKGGLFLEQAAALQVIAFDKTGTLTSGKPRVLQVIPLHPARSEQDLVTIAASLEKYSEHPLASAILDEFSKIQTDFVGVTKFSAIPGKGASGWIDNTLYYVGSYRLFEGLSDSVMTVHKEFLTLQQAGNTLVWIGTDQEILGVIEIADQIRPESAKTVNDLKELGIKKVILLTGDHAQTASNIATQLSVDEYFGEMLPEDKLYKIKEFKYKYGDIAMVGDGINDAPALAAASLGIAMGAAGSDAALETANVVLMGDDLSKLPYLVQIGRSTMRIIKQNLSFSILIKLAAIFAVFPGWLTLWLAIMADMGATILVTLNGLRLLKAKPLPKTTRIGGTFRAGSDI